MPPQAELNGWLTLTDPLGNALFAAAGWDSITLDAQHGQFDDQTLRTTLHALAAAKPRRYVRIRENSAALIGRALDAGADGVIIPMVNTAAEASAAAAACLYPPHGNRSYGPGLAALRPAPNPIAILPMIETKAALDAVAEILATPSISGVFVGPNDLALALGYGPGADREEPGLLAAFHTILAAARAAGKTAGIYCAAAPYARRMIELGFTLVVGGTDTICLNTAAAACLRELRTQSSASRD